MNYYQEISLLPNFEINLFKLWSETFQQIHFGLVEVQDGQKRVPIGVSFPEYKMGEKFAVLGSKLRLFAPDETVLAQFDANKWLAQLCNYVHCTSIRQVPDDVKGYAVYRRDQPKSSKERLARRYAKRHGLDYETTLNGNVKLSVKPQTGMECEKMLMSYSEMPHKTITSPFIRLKSLSNGNLFCLWIKKSKMENRGNGTFSTYGLSSTSTVPEF